MAQRWLKLVQLGATLVAELGEGAPEIVRRHLDPDPRRHATPGSVARVAKRPEEALYAERESGGRSRRGAVKGKFTQEKEKRTNRAPSHARAVARLRLKRWT